MLEPVDIDRHRCSGKPEDRTKRSVGTIANQRGIVSCRNGVDCGEKSVNDSVEVLVPDSRQHLEPDAVILQLSRRNVVRAAIDGDVVSAGDQSGGKMFSKSFEPAIAGGNASRS